jgi:hypothetical protein
MLAKVESRDGNDAKFCVVKEKKRPMSQNNDGTIITIHCIK